MILYPNFYCKNIKDVDIKRLNENNIKGILLDVDNTLIDLEHNLLEGAEEWCNNLKKHNIKFCILSNSNNKEKIKKVSAILDIPYISFGMKPLKRGYKKASKLLNLPYENLAIIGDQIFTDIIGGNRCKMYTILVDPISTRELFITAIKRGLENKILDKYKEKQQKEKEG